MFTEGRSDGESAAGVKPDAQGTLTHICTNCFMIYDPALTFLLSAFSIFT